MNNEDITKKLDPWQTPGDNYVQQDFIPRRVKNLLKDSMKGAVYGLLITGIFGFAADRLEFNRETVLYTIGISAIVVSGIEGLVDRYLK